jgi:hypothetical protein
MKKILQGAGLKIGSLFSHLDTNFIGVCNYLLKFANPDYVLKGYADSANEPSDPDQYDCYLVLESGTIWELSVEADEIIYWNGAQWGILPYKITELNAKFQAYYFNADLIACIPPEGMTATDVQSAIEELAAEVFGTGGENGGSGSGSI